MSLNEKDKLEKFEEKIVVKNRTCEKDKSDGYSMYVHNKRFFIAWFYNSDLIG